MKVIVTFTSCCDDPWKSKFMALEKPAKLREFFLLLYGHPVKLQSVRWDVRPGRCLLCGLLRKLYFILSLLIDRRRRKQSRWPSSRCRRMSFDRRLQPNNIKIRTGHNYRHCTFRKHSTVSSVTNYYQNHWHTDQLSLAIPLWVGIMNTSNGYSHH